jgi:hypothetical protein
MDGVRVRRSSGTEQSVDVQVTVCRRRWTETDGLISSSDVGRARVGIGVDGDRFDPKFAAGARDAHRDLATIGDEQALDHSPLQPGFRF